VNARLLVTMTCANELLHGGSHAFRDELYHKQRASTFMSLGLLLDAKLVKITAGNAPHDRAGHHASGRRTLHFHQCRLPRPGNAPSDQAVMTALDEGLPKTLLSWNGG